MSRQERNVTASREKSDELKSALKKESKQRTYKTKFKNLAKDVVKSRKRIELRTTFALSGTGKRKNLAYYDKSIYNILKSRKNTEITHNGRDVTPRFLTETDLLDIEESYSHEERKLRSDSLWDKIIEDIEKTKRSSDFDPEFHIDKEESEVFPDMDDIQVEVIDRTESTEMLDVETTIRHIKDDRKAHPHAQKPKHFIKLTLTETDDIVLFESVSLTALKGTEEAEAVEKYNSDYEYLTKGPGKSRRTNNAEVQTENVLVKSRTSNTERIKKSEQGSFVSNFEMFDTYADLAKRTKEIHLDDDSDRKIELTTYSREGENIDEILNANENFHFSSMILQRLLAGNVYRERQKRFRNMIAPNPLDLNVRYLYRISTLWTYKSAETMGKEVVDMSWCKNNGDLLAVAYGAYYFRDSKERFSGSVLIWSIKNPVNPERCYRFKVPVTAVEFSVKNPQLMAVALYDGTIEVIDVTDTVSDQHKIVAKSEKKSSPGFEPVWQIQWIQLKDKEYIVTASQDGRVMRYEIATGPFLVGFQQLRLDRIEGVVEALHYEHKKNIIEADRHPQALCLQKHPVNSDSYFVGTDEGCIHLCSINFPHQHLGVLQVHNSGVYSIDFSPFSSKIFLTAGSDWTIRIWMEDVHEPIMELSDGFDAIHMACWSPIHSTIIASCTQSTVQIWDLRRKNLKPASVQRFSSYKLTIIKFSPCGQSLLIGDDSGHTYLCSLEDFPFPPYFQYDELQKALKVKLPAVDSGTT